ncbi:DUF1190 domain-containing protein [Ferrovibrio sp.]|jgi:uncharacterized protein YgiB involved in biofilm formation|uniref:DUF1190 domain-containing protein n=1 Tax=Ferrovibrio sp. TaxID=1917215 RepID=UPI0035B40932
MRKSRVIRLALLGTVGLVGLAGCDDSDPLAGHDVLRDQKECASRPDPDGCRIALADARAQHVQTAPRFTSREECETQFGLGNCGTPQQILSANDAFSTAQPAGDPSQPAPQPQQQAQSSGGVFMPMLMGYMIGRSLAGPSPWSAPGAAQPLYRDPGNTAYTGSKPLGQLSANRFPDAPKAAPGYVSRGGFGRTGTSYSAAS